VPLPALLLVLVAAAFHALWNLTLHTTTDRPATMVVSGLVGGLVLLPAVVLSPPWFVFPLIILSALAEAAYGLCLSSAYQHGALAVAYPIGRGTAPLLVTLGAWLILAQWPSLTPVLGAVALALGLILVATAGRLAGQSRAVGFAVLTGCCIAGYSLIDSQAVRHVGPVGYLGAVLLLQGLFLFGAIRGNLGRVRRALWPGVRIALGSTAAYLLVLLAFQQAGAGRVATLREMSVLIGIVLAGGKPGWRILVGGTFVVGGAILTAI
jgi:drug/metabolite transporter (DMT)-like permease